MIYKGVPGGVLGWNPTVDERTGLAVAPARARPRPRADEQLARFARDRAELRGAPQVRGDEHHDDHHHDETQAHHTDHEETVDDADDEEARNDTRPPQSK